ncbi:MAG: enoyl-CoA hydratase/isomerase family protein [Gammaproteobacteria bacterium]|nr:enoyl-CoA hydratase-related protein [Gammaproteobacteria bacterium]MXW50995.1 enoyl-CoA hydratase/isomerase family protein [Gammaproteobacteria bacterium]MYE87191.1 enoyl-CoA hydratase/isomerase family protein [Gammaproteobacteria bacterium]MYF50813.1 enoyl-CoA hydratase/isomerase family protein [Gammaproteobacteria bacterium]
MAFSDYQYMRLTRRDRILTIALDNGKVNAINGHMHRELARVFLDAQDDEDSDLVILTGAGNAFCAGGDMDWFLETIEDPRRFRAILPEAKRIVNSLLELEKPLICRLNGAAAGLGATIALMSDIIVAADTATIGDPHVKAGLVAGDGGAIIWPQLIGFARAKELLLTGDMLPADEAARIGLINYAVPAEELDAKVDEIAGKILGNPRWAVRWTKTATNITLRELAVKLLDPAVAYEIVTNMTEDRKEAVAAFIERRKPKFTGE